MDGFSRKIMWLVVSVSNSDPLIIANFYLDMVVRTNNLCPNLVRMDRGNENVYLEDLQTFFTSSDDSYLYAASTRNQRIESFWSRLKKFKLIWWIDFFRQMERVKLFKSASEIHQEVLLFCFIPVLQHELNVFMSAWNGRNIRMSAETPGGVPNLLFRFPESVGYEMMGSEVTSSDLQTAFQTLKIDHHPIYRNKDLHELLSCYVGIHNFQFAKNYQSALDLYVNLLQCLENDNFDV